MSKTIEEIKEEYFKEIGFKSLNDAVMETAIGMSKIGSASVLENHFTKIAERYAKSQTQELQEQNDNLANNLLEMSNSLVGLIKENNNLKDLSNTITGLQLQEQNAELVDILSRIVEKQFDSKYSLQSLNNTISEAKELLTKYNHLKSNTNG